MSVLPVGFGGEEVSGYAIANSLRLRSSASAYLSRTPASAGNRKTWTWSGWVKRGTLGVINSLFGADDGSLYGYLHFIATDALRFYNPIDTINTENVDYSTTAVFRDPSAHYHIVLRVDTTNATAADRIQFWVNGVRQTATVTVAASLNRDLNINRTIAHSTALSRVSQYTDGYLSDVYFIDGQALDPTSFGQFNSDGVWTPKQYTGTYGTNGFYLKFNDGSNLTNLCLDRSGNGNNWTATNVSLTAGATYDWMVDTPSVNYAVLNALRFNGSLSNANLTLTGPSSATGYVGGSIAVTSGKWYWEGVATAINSGSSIVAFGAAKDICGGAAPANTDWYMYDNAGNKIGGGSAAVAYGATYVVGDVIGVALDLDGGTITFYKNNVSQGVAFSGITSVSLTPFMFAFNTLSTVHLNVGQRPWSYGPPDSSFKALNTANLPAVTVPNGRRNFDALTYTGNGGSLSVTGAQFQPDFVWNKCRNTAGTNHRLWDVVRGATKSLSSDLTTAEITESGLTSFDASGFSLGSQVGSNGSGNTFAAWLWKAGGAAVTNTAGSISSQVSANTAAGISIVTYTGTGANATVGHGLGVAPKLVIVKSRSNGTAAWVVYHASTGATGELVLSSTAAFATNAADWNNTAPSSSVFSLGTANAVNQNTQTFVAYCFSEVAGFSKFGSYTGNGSADGPFVFCGFRPRWVMVKSSSAAENWLILDAVTGSVNVISNTLLPNSSSAEITGTDRVDFTANGFKVRAGSAISPNTSGATYVYAAFAENPFGGSNVAPVTAR